MTKDIIYRQEAIELAMHYCPDDDGTCSKADEDIRNLLDELENLSSAVVDAEPVKQERCEFCKDGKTFLGAVLVLGNDGNWHSIRDCPSCGAKMDASTQKSVGNALEALDEAREEAEINPCRGCEDYDGKGGCLSHGGCAEGREDAN